MATVYTQDMLNKLKRAYASGTLRITYEGKTLEYRSMAEMERAMNTVRRELESESGTGRSRQVRMKTGRGLQDECE